MIQSNADSLGAYILLVLPDGIHGGMFLRFINGIRILEFCFCRLFIFGSFFGETIFRNLGSIVENRSFITDRRPGDSSFFFTRGCTFCRARIFDL